jgi:mannose-1-phosphate guanylyltransferase/mannose-1-phosphate guanylyltransferase/phosphomannomutase
MIMAAGLGTRLRPVTYEMPKPMVPVLNRPVMEHILELLERHGFREVIANLHWFPELIKGHFGDGSRLGVELSYSEEEELLGTAGGVRNAAAFLGDSFLVISADAVTDVDLGAMRDFHGSHDGIATLATKRVEDTSEFGVVVTDSDGRVQGFQEKPDPAEALSDLGNCGIYVFEPEIFDYFPDRDFVDWAQDVFPALLEQDVPFYGHEIADYWNDIGNIKEFRQGNFDALSGEVRVDVDSGGLNPDADWVEDQPVYVGEGCEIGPGVRLMGPVVLGHGCKVGEGAAIRDSVLWPHAEVAPREVLIGAVAGTGPLPDKL